MPDENILFETKPNPELPEKEQKEDPDFVNSLFDGEPEIILKAVVLWQLPLFHRLY